MQFSKNAGFTLIELSIVLVIIGLITGGILVGKDLIYASQIRATIGQYEKYRSAVNAFKTKYNALPGDLTSTTAAALGLKPTTRAGHVGTIHGNGILDDNFEEGEFLLFWQDLSSANLIDGNFSSMTDDLFYVQSPTTFPSQYWPSTKLNRQYYWSVTGTSDVPNAPPCTPNCYYLQQFDDHWTGNVMYLYSQEAYRLDVKVDDGRPGSGGVQEAWKVYGQPNNICMDGTDDYPLKDITMHNCGLYFTF